MRNMVRAFSPAFGLNRAMNFRRLLVTLFPALFLSPLAALHSADAPTRSRSEAKTAEGKPNIVVIVADDLGNADVLFNPQHPKEVTTPNLDALAKQSVICRQAM